MTKQIKYLFVTALFVMLSGCFTLPKNVEPASEKGSGAKTITIYQYDRPEEYSAVISFSSKGLIHDLIMANKMISNSSDLTRALVNQNINLYKSFDSSLQSGLESMGLVTNRKSIPSGIRFNDWPKETKTESDLSLVFEVESGYESSNYVSYYYPFITVNARLVKSSTKEVFYQQQFLYGYYTGPDGVLKTRTPELFHIIEPRSDEEGFRNIDQIVESPKLARDYLVIGIKPIIDKVLKSIGVVIGKSPDMSYVSNIDAKASELKQPIKPELSPLINEAPPKESLIAERPASIQPKKTSTTLTQVNSNGSDLIQKLRALDKIHKEGLITEIEFAKKKQDLLDGL